MNLVQDMVHRLLVALASLITRPRRRHAAYRQGWLDGRMAMAYDLHEQGKRAEFADNFDFNLAAWAHRDAEDSLFHGR